MRILSATVVAEHFRRAIRAEIPVATSAHRPYKGEVQYEIGGWHVSVSYYEGHLDYCERVVSADGREGQYDDWTDGEGSGNPISLLTIDEAKALEATFEHALQSGA